jgi:hypothetical protein
MIDGALFLTEKKPFLNRCLRAHISHGRS